MRHVTVLAHGGLGNQLFQLAAGYSLGAVNRTLSYSSGWKSGHPTLADLGLPVAYPNRLVRTTVPGVAMRETWKDEVSERVARALGALRGITVVTQEHPFDERPVEMESDRLVLSGYFQHPSWWSDSWRSIADLIADQAPNSAQTTSSKIHAVVKVRRSDYLELGWALTSDWLSHAIELLGFAGQDVHVLAEDEETRAFAIPILHAHRCKVVPPPTLVPNPHLNDFWTMALSHQVISANSSFSWWACAVAEVMHGSSVAYPTPWLPRNWSRKALPDMGLPGWISVIEPRFQLGELEN